MNSLKIPGGVVTDTASAVFLERAIEIASHRVEDYVPPNIAKAIKYYATKVRTKESTVFASLLATTAASISGHIVFKVSSLPTDTHHYVPALNLLVISYPGGGKSQSIDKYCINILEHMEELTGKTIIGSPANFAALREFLMKCHGKGAIISDEIFKLLFTFTGNPITSEAINIFNCAYSGKRLKRHYKKAQNLDLKDSCLSICGTIHPTSATNIIRAWSGGDGFRQRWLYTAVDDDIPDARSCYELHLAEDAAPPYDLVATFVSLNQTYSRLPELYELHLSDEARHLYFNLSSDILDRRRHQRKNINLTTNFDSLSSKQEELTMRVCFLIHMLVHSINSYHEFGEVHVPQESSAEDFQRAMKYVSISNTVFQIFHESSLIDSDLSLILSMGGPFIYPRLISEHTGGKNVPKYAEKDVFVAICKQLEAKGLGQWKEITVSTDQRGINTTYPVFFKVPPNMIESVTLYSLNMTITEYDAAYYAPPKLRPSIRTRLTATLNFLSTKNPYGNNESSSSEPEEFPASLRKDLTENFPKTYGSPYEHSRSGTPFILDSSERQMFSHSPTSAQFSDDEKLETRDKNEDYMSDDEIFS